METQVTAYLNRIGFEGSAKPTLDTLSRLQYAHLHTIPYENLDILNGVPLSLEISRLFDKIVNRRRGGYCFELNALFGWLLEELGFQVKHYFGRFWRDEAVVPCKRRHHILQVELDGIKYIVDVGAGAAAPRWPLKLLHGIVQEQQDEWYRLMKDRTYGWLLEERKGDEWRTIYSFTEEPNLPFDYVTTSYWCENSPESIFRKGAMVAIRTEEGRNTIAGKEFRIFSQGSVNAFEPSHDDHYSECLRKYFGILID
ncbi:arylamine N-acetyltransferase family protein [Paenibacillus harenae]|uniref:N-hydroxyarylamine O-acetyltransferase n=1 Tax=Paenibacillus harenae TaxID=306543 RepID=A0ABT9TZ65_PAEHA|nr:arylamine N-acetyltransferase [Paenibacillus harenae]MDQ0112665.1 N-hydroxyarylamine O-acetyltransferase [Paenibacillus harenae]